MVRASSRGARGFWRHGHEEQGKEVVLQAVVGRAGPPDYLIESASRLLGTRAAAHAIRARSRSGWTLHAIWGGDAEQVQSGRKHPGGEVTQDQPAAQRRFGGSQYRADLIEGGE